MIAARLANESEPMDESGNLDDYVQGSTVAFFPQTFTWNSKSSYIRSGYHDVPWAEPALVRDLLRPSWPERQWLSRIYHHFRIAKRPSEMKFQDASSNEGSVLDSPQKTGSV